MVRARDSSHSKTGKTTQSDTEHHSESQVGSQRGDAELEERKTHKPKIDKDLIEKGIKERNEEKFFEKEFAKEMKKKKEKEKMEAEIRELKEKDPTNPDIAKLSKKLKGQTKKPDIYDKFAEGELGIDEFIEKVKQKQSKGTTNIGRGKRIPNNLSQKRLNLTTVVNRDNVRRMSQEGDGEVEEKKADGMLNMADILAELDEENSEKSEDEKKK